MSQVRITIDTDNAAFDSAPQVGVAETLERFAKRLRSIDCMAGYHPLSPLDGKLLQDFNGNTVGKCEVVED